MTLCVDCNAPLPANSRLSRCSTCHFGYQMRTVHLEIRTLVKQQNALIQKQTTALEFICQSIKEEQARRG